MYQMHPPASYCDEMLAGECMAEGCAFSFEGVIFHCELKWGEMKEKGEKREGKERNKGERRECK